MRKNLHFYKLLSGSVPNPNSNERLASPSSYCPHPRKQKFKTREEKLKTQQHIMPAQETGTSPHRSLFPPTENAPVTYRWQITTLFFFYYCFTFRSHVPRRGGMSVHYFFNEEKINSWSQTTNGKLFICQSKLGKSRSLRMSVWPSADLFGWKVFLTFHGKIKPRWTGCSMTFRCDGGEDIMIFKVLLRSKHGREWV